MVKRYVPPIVNGPIRLRLLEESDLPVTLSWRNDDEIRRWFFNPDRIAPEQHRDWFAEYQERDDDFVFIIEGARDLRRPVGQASLYHVEWTANRAEFGRLMIGDPEARGKGLANAATDALVNLALDSWGMREVYLQVLASNAPALAIYNACGFVITGREADVLTMTKRSG